VVFDQGEADPTTGLILGVIFHTTVANGKLVAIRYWEQNLNMGVGEVALWRLDDFIDDGYSATPIATSSTVVLAPPSPGWQVVKFASPVPIVEDTDYIVSIQLNQEGYYSATNGYFDGNLQVMSPSGYLATCVGCSPGNGVYLYAEGTQGQNPFPSSFQNTNYWVDPVVTYASDAGAAGDPHFLVRQDFIVGPRNGMLLSFC